MTEYSSYLLVTCICCEGASVAQVREQLASTDILEQHVQVTMVPVVPFPNKQNILRIISVLYRTKTISRF